VTPINRAWIDDLVKRRMVVSRIPMRRAGESWEMASAAAWLCSDEAAYITGQTFFVDGRPQRAAVCAMRDLSGRLGPAPPNAG
jgi:NAD(P)-dependent dehydrogenase (short-subunit alcohol dehydrogenase family)